MGELFGWMTGETGPIETHQLPRLSDEVEASLRTIPEVAQILEFQPPEPGPDATPAEFASYQNATMAWYNQVMQQYGDKMGEMVEVSPIPPEDHTHIDPEVEALMMGLKAPAGTEEFLNRINVSRPQTQPPSDSESERPFHHLDIVRGDDSQLRALSAPTPGSIYEGVSAEELRAEKLLAAESLGRTAVPPAGVVRPEQPAPSSWPESGHFPPPPANPSLN